VDVTLELTAMAIGGSSLGRINLLQQAIEVRVGCLGGGIPPAVSRSTGLSQGQLLVANGQGEGQLATRADVKGDSYVDG